MFSYLVRRCLYGALILLGVNLLTFFLFFTVNTPDDMARLNIGGKHITQDLIDKWKVERGYDKPLYLQRRQAGRRAHHRHHLLGSLGVAVRTEASAAPTPRAPATSAPR